MLVYNQEDYVINALDSIFNQKVLPFEVIIGNDCSIDGTKEVLENYRLRFPDIIKVYNHETNLGIYANQNFLIDKVEGDIVSFLSGDDLLKNGVFEELNNVVISGNINLKSPFLIITNTSILFPDGTEIIWDNFNYKNQDTFKQRIRGTINCRAIGISALALKTTSKTDPDLGMHADWIWSLRFTKNAKYFYYTPFVSAVYRMGIGVVSSAKTQSLASSRLKVISIILDEFKDELDTKDLKYLNLEIAYYKYKLNENGLNYIRYLYQLLKNKGNYNGLSIFSRYQFWVPMSFIKFYSFIKKTL
jgi:glycosyltransferase involved in cell wall biosynthesis